MQVCTSNSINVFVALIKVWREKNTKIKRARIKISQSALNLAQRAANSYNIDDVALEGVSFTMVGVHNTVRWLAVIATDDTACGRRQLDGDRVIYISSLHGEKYFARFH